jgi:hypothetical protein
MDKIFDRSDFTYEEQGNVLKIKDGPIYTICYPYEVNQLYCGFDNRQFYVQDAQSGKKERFRFQWENEEYKIFASELGTKCIITK